MQLPLKAEAEASNSCETEDRVTDNAHAIGEVEGVDEDCGGATAEAKEDEIEATPEEEGAIAPESEVVVANLSHMPDLVLRKIFSFLPSRERGSIELVCRRWFEIWRCFHPISSLCLPMDRFLTPRGFENDQFTRFIDHVRDRCELKRIVLMEVGPRVRRQMQRNGDGLVVKYPVWFSFKDSDLISALVMIGRTFPLLDTLEVKLWRFWEPLCLAMDQVVAEFLGLRHLVLNSYAAMGKPERDPSESPLAWPSLISLTIKQPDGSSRDEFQFVDYPNILKICRGSSASLRKFHLTGDFSICSPFIEKLVALCPLLEDVKLEVVQMSRAVSRQPCPYSSNFINASTENAVVDHTIANLRQLKLKRLKLRFHFARERHYHPSFPTNLEAVFEGQGGLQYLSLEINGVNLNHQRIFEMITRECPNLSTARIDIGGFLMQIRNGATWRRSPAPVLQPLPIWLNL